MATKRTKEELRAYINGRLMAEQGTEIGPRSKGQARAATGAMIDGPTLTKVSKIAEAIPDPKDRAVLLNTLGTFTKHQALSMALSSGAPLFKRYPEIMAQVADIATEDDYNHRGVKLTP